jgi:hypothetical protein
MNIQELILRALENYRGDDLFRAKLAFKGMTPEEMQGQHGQSGFTRQSILDGYVQRERDVDAAVRWVKERP